MSNGDKPVVVVTGAAGNLGCRLLPLLDDFRVVGVDIVPPRNSVFRFEKIDVGREAACRQFVQLLKQSEARAIVHLASVVHPVQSGPPDMEQMWQINVAGTARVMEAITEVNRHGGVIDTFIFPSSAFVYGSETPGPVKETYPLDAHTFPYAMQKQQADEAVRFRSETLGKCSTYVLRPTLFTGATVDNYMVGVLRGLPTGKSKRAERMRQQGKRLSLLTPGKRYRENRFQFVHVDDVARLVSYVLHRSAPHRNELTVLNVAGRGEPITFEDVSAIAQTRVRQLPGKWAMREMLRLLWQLGISALPPEAAPYMYGSHLVDTTRLKQFLGLAYERVIQHSVATALQDTFRSSESRSIGVAEGVSK